MLSKTLALLFIFLVPAMALAQLEDVLENLPADAPWRSGSLLTSDNEILKGYVKFDGLSSRMAFKKKLDDEVKNIFLKDILAAEIFDSELAKVRRYATFDVEGKQGKTQALCEIVMEMQNFLVLSYIQSEISVVQKNEYGNSKRVKGHSLSEIVFFVDADGQAVAEEIMYAPHFRHNGKEMLDFWLRHSPRFDEETLLRFMQDRQAQVKQFLKENPIRPIRKNAANPNLREEVFALLSYYKSLEGE